MRKKHRTCTLNPCLTSLTKTTFRSHLDLHQVRMPEQWKPNPYFHIIDFQKLFKINYSDTEVILKNIERYCPILLHGFVKYSRTLTQSEGVLQHPVGALDSYSNFVTRPPKLHYFNIVVLGLHCCLQC